MRSVSMRRRPGYLTVVAGVAKWGPTTVGFEGMAGGPNSVGRRTLEFVKMGDAIVVELEVYGL